MESTGRAPSPRPVVWALALATTGSLTWATTPILQAAGYERPSDALAQIVEAPPTPSVRLSPDRAFMLLVETPTLTELTDLAQEELRLAGIRIRPTTNGRSRLRYARKLTLMARESILHMVWEMERWLALNVSDAERGLALAAQD